MDPLFCLMLIKGRLNPVLGRKLLHAAGRLVLEGRSAITINDHGFYAEVKTDQTVVTLGDFTGVKFYGQAESRDGTVELTFFVRQRDLREADIDRLTAVPFTL